MIRSWNQGTVLRNWHRIDLHTHTTASDGILSPEELVALAVERGLDVIAICDHDTTEGIAPALRAAAGTALTVIPSIEMSADIPLAEVHILGYMIDFTSQYLQQTLVKLRRSRLGRAKRIVEKLAALGVPLNWERVLEIAGGGAVGRPHIALAMVEKGYVSSPAEAFQLYLGRNALAYVERYKLAPAQVIELISHVHGIPVLAHPLTAVWPAKEMGEGLDHDKLLPSLIKAGLAGLEVFYPDYSLETIDDLLKLATRYHLIATGGSDFHGWGVSANRLGVVDVPREALDSLHETYELRYGRPYILPNL